MEKVSPEMEAFILASCAQTLAKLLAKGASHDEAVLEIALNIEMNPELHAKFVEFNQVRDHSNGRASQLRYDEFGSRRVYIPSSPSTDYEPPMEVWRRSLETAREHVWRGKGHASGGGPRSVY